MQGRTFNAGPHVSMQGRTFQCRAVAGRTFLCSRTFLRRTERSTQGRTFNAGPYVSLQGRTFHCRAVRFNARPYVQCKALTSNAGAYVLMQGRTSQCSAVRFNAGPYVSMQGRTCQCRAVRSMQGRTFQCRAVRFNAGPYVSMQGRTFNAGVVRSRHVLRSRAVRSLHRARSCVQCKVVRGSSHFCSNVVLFARATSSLSFVHSCLAAREGPVEACSEAESEGWTAASGSTSTDGVERAPEEISCRGTRSGHHENRSHSSRNFQSATGQHRGEGLEAALARAEHLASIPPVDKRIADAEAFIVRAKKRIAAETNLRT